MTRITRPSLLMTYDQWNKLLAEKKIEDISHELPDGFLMCYQTMRAKVVYNGKRYFANAWHAPQSAPFVELREVA